MQSGQGAALLPVTVTAELSGTPPVNEPPGVVSVPLAGAENELSTQVERPPFAIESGGPKLQPVSEQLLMLPVWAAVRAEMLQLPAAQVAVKNVSAPAGVGLSGTVAPPPRLSPQVPPAAPVVKRSGATVGAGPFAWQAPSATELPLQISL